MAFELNYPIKRLTERVYSTPSTVVEVPLVPGNRGRFITELIYKLSGSPSNSDDAMIVPSTKVRQEFNYIHKMIFGKPDNGINMQLILQTRGSESLLSKEDYSSDFLKKIGMIDPKARGGVKNVYTPNERYLKRRHWHLMRGNILAALTDGVVSTGYSSKVLAELQDPAWTHKYGLDPYKLKDKRENKKWGPEPII
jgi:hypothetical protein